MEKLQQRLIGPLGLDLICAEGAVEVLDKLGMVQNAHWDVLTLQWVLNQI